MKQNKYAQALATAFVFIFLMVCFSGCTSNQNVNGNGNIFSGTWVGNVEMSLFGRSGNTSVSKIAFSGNTVELTVNTEQGTFTTNYTYSINGSTFILEPQFNGRGGFPGRQPYNGTHSGNWTRPSANETWPINGTMPDNSTQSSNWTRPGNGTWNPGNERPSMSISFTFSVNEDHTVIYLNGAEFRKI
ncbi:MAG TPA: hypothetical protein VN377_01945 [Candidatus Thermoplasmatota archaeon]|nr:hypothetical protein [Candidatus Thermoplasmatota archaeon]